MSRRLGIALALLLGGCFNAFVPDAPIKPIHPGFPEKSDVARILGPPTRQTATPAGEEIWHYRLVGLGPGTQGMAQFIFGGEVLSRCLVHPTVGILPPA